MKGFFVAGTDTGVGKTEIARAICASLARKGLRPLALKPVETGCEPDRPEDALALREACGSAQSLDEVCPYRFRLPAAPLVAAEAEGAQIDLLRIEQLVARASTPIVVEAAGGLLVPLARAGLGFGEPLPDHKHEERRNDEQNHRIARQPVGEAAPAGRFQILLHGQGPDVAHPPPVQVAGGRMVQGMLPAPVIVRGKGQHARDEAQNVIGSARF